MCFLEIREALDLLGTIQAALHPEKTQKIKRGQWIKP